MNEEEILFRDEVMKKLRYTGISAFHKFFNTTVDFPRPFKIGKRNAWYREDVQNWLDEQRRKAQQQ
ncbi:hypothetical protein AG28_25780 [Salmonella enterica subsp. enterica]|nr:AlpA family phage regulatory protein [Salmonella enterica]EAT2223409.1 AlpA family phage regulatory protein [Salmonella enterica]ECG1137199.1 hypothetical protein [Salmonella enterica subsp. enterica]EEO5743300.1 AlpA family phage regulatory protein [Salmonella enterica]